MRDHTKELGMGSSDGNSQAVMDGSTPMELLAALSLIAIAIARIQHSVMLTSSSDPTLKLRVEKVLDCSWLDLRSAELFNDLLAIL